MSLASLLLAACASASPGAPTLRLTVEDAVRLAMRSDAVRFERLAHETARLEVTGARGRAYDPTVTSSLVTSQGATPTTFTNEGVPIVNDGRDSAGLQVEQTLVTGARASLSLSGSRTDSNRTDIPISPLYESSVQVALVQPLLRNRTGLQIRGPVSVAEHGAQASRATLEAELATAVEDAVNLYWRTVLAQERLEVRRKSLALAETTHAKNRRLLELGALAPLEIHRSESDVASRKLDVLSSEFEYRRQADDLRRGLGLDADPATAGIALELLDRPGAADSVETAEAAAVEEALRARPELLALKSRLDADATRVRLAREDTLVGLDLRGSYMLAGVAGTEFIPGEARSVLARTRLDHAFDQMVGRQFPTWSLSLTLNVPTRNRAARAALASARIDEERRRIEIAELKRRIALEIRAALDGVENARQSIALATAVRDHAEQTFEAERRKYELGTIELFFVLEAQTRLAQAELALLQARANHELARVRLDRVTGRLLARYGVSAETERVTS